MKKNIQSPWATSERKQSAASTRNMAWLQEATLYLALHCDSCQIDSTSQRSQERSACLSFSFFWCFSFLSKQQPLPSPHLCPLLSGSFFLYISLSPHLPGPTRACWAPPLWFNGSCLGPCREWAGCVLRAASEISKMRTESPADLC